MTPSLPLFGLVSLAGALFFIDPAAAQSFNLDLGDSGVTATGRIIQMIALITVISLAPSILVMVTSFTRIIIVLSLLRTALGTAQSPPNQVMVALALFLTIFIMMPTFERVWDEGLRPMVDGDVEEFEGFERSVRPVHEFMMAHVREKDLELFNNISVAGDPSGTDSPQAADPQEVELRVLIPAFMISELRRAFEIGFLLFIPFLIIDMVVASVLMAMGMMMLPPVIISLPFKLIFFVLVDGWFLVAGSLVRSFN